MLRERVVQLFDLQEDRQRADTAAPSLFASLAVVPEPGTLTYITGPSGGGKSSFLRAIRRAAVGHRVRWMTPRDARLPARPAIDLVCRALCEPDPASAFDRGLATLAQAGLAEAWAYTRPPSRLSDGERWRLRLALLFAAAESARNRSERPVLAIDEFAATLDRVTAAVVARLVRRTVDRSAPVAAVIVTSHDDLERALDPDVLIQCDFGQPVVRKRRPRATA